MSAELTEITQVDEAACNNIAKRIADLKIPADIEIELAVKTQTAHTIAHAAAALELLERPALLGHNRIQEACATIPAVQAINPHINVAMIGPLQTNKINQMLRVCNELATVDSADLATALAPRVQKSGHKSFPVWIQVNISAEQTKSGCRPETAIPLALHCDSLGLSVKGFMTVGLNSDDLVAVAAGYARLRQIRDEAITELPNASGLSMGMSNDYRVAIAEGATRIRLGTVIFGKRN